MVRRRSYYSKLRSLILTLKHLILTGKKVKRTGEASLFSEQTGKLTDEATNMCRSLGIETKDLYPKYVLVKPLRYFTIQLIIDDMCVCYFSCRAVDSFMKKGMNI